MTAPRDHSPERHPAVLALGLINASPGSLLNQQFVREHEDTLREYGMLPDLEADQEPAPNPAWHCLNAAAQAHEKAGHAARFTAQGQDATPVWRRVHKLLAVAFNQAQAAQLQVWDFTHHDSDFLNAAWNSIMRDLTFAQNLVAQEFRLTPKDPASHPDQSWPVNRQASLVEALTPISRLNAYDQAALLRTLAAALFRPRPDSSPDQQARMAQAAQEAWAAAEDLLFHAAANPGQPTNFSIPQPRD